jgi:prevent-host-death family protein
MVMKSATKIRTIPAGEFKAKCLQLMDEVQSSGLHIIVTKRGRPVVEIAPPAKKEEKPFRSILGRSRGAKILGDIIGPSDDEWNAEKGIWDPS